MPGDLVSLRILVISAGLPDHELWRQAISNATVPIELEILGVAPALALLVKARIDVCILDADLPGADKSVLARAARAVPPDPLIFMMGPKDTPRPAGIDGVIGRPCNANEVHNLVQLCIRAKIPTRVLVVDDSSTMRKIVRKILQASHFALKIDEAEEGASALALLRAEKFGIVFLDYNMPGLNGFDTLTGIKQDYPNVAVVMMTSTLDNAIADRAHAAGALAFLKKPFYPADIDATLERYYGLTVPRR
jgi:CheY-like chemotaxis protein